MLYILEISRSWHVQIAGDCGIILSYFSPLHAGLTAADSSNGSIGHHGRWHGSDLIAIESNKAVAFDNVSHFGEPDLSKLTGPIGQQFKITKLHDYRAANFQE